jgi:hypothetical protein
MADFIHLTGTEDVQRAASRMSEAAHDMQRAASTMEGAVERFERALTQHEVFLDDWLERFTAVVHGVERETKPEGET